MYYASQHSFDIGTSTDKAFNIFNEEIYKKLSSWRWYRPSKLNDCWSSRLIFNTIKSEFAQFTWKSGVTLTNFYNSGQYTSLLTSLKKMQGIKPNAGYPVMAVSKFLHFYNPLLFPIYDNEVIWNRVFRRFKGEFKQFCGSSNIPMNTGETAEFLGNYVCWASSLMASAHSQFMESFAGWLSRQPNIALKQEFQASFLYSTAFEFTAIGAAEAELAER